MGSRAGIPNKRSGMIRDRLKEFGCDPTKILADAAMNKLDCGTCRGKLRTRYALPAGSHADGCEAKKKEGACTCDGISERVCQSCYGSGMEAISVRERVFAAAELLSYTEAKRKAIEHSGIDGEDIGVKLVVEFTK